MNPLKTMNAEELSTILFPPQRYLVENLIPTGLTLLAGAGKAGKSWLVLLLAMRVAKGLPLWDRATTRCEVLYLCMEDSYSRLQQRMYRLGEEPDQALRFAIVCDRLRGGLEEQITEHLRQYPKTGLVIIDTLQRVRDPNSADIGSMYANDYADMVSLKNLADAHGIGLLLVHHLRKTKDKEDPFNELNGSNGIMGALDTCLLLKRQSRGSEIATLTVTGRDLEDQFLCLQFNDCVWELSEIGTKQEEAPPPMIYPPFLYSLSAFLRQKVQWEGTATELLEELDEKEVKACGVAPCLNRYYYDFLEPRGISYHSRRTSKNRLLCLSYDAANDRHDENDENDDYDDFSE